MTGLAVAADPAGAPGLLAVAVRGGLVETHHRGHLVGLGPTGEIVLRVGDPAAVGYPRSSLKPVQALGIRRHGARLADEQLAISAASHSGEPRHRALAAAILAGAGLDESALQCPPAVPRAEPGAALSRLAHNCSGKHAAMLAACVAAGDDPAGYLEPGSPLQQRIRATVEQLTGAPVDRVTVDGCGAPLFAVAPLGLARAFAALLTEGPDGPAIVAAMRAHPGVVGGRDRHVTRLMEAVPGLVAKDGADGVYAAVLADGSAVALKLEDGADAPLPVVLVAAVAALGADVSAVPPDLVATPVLGGGLPVGELRAVPLGRG